MSTESNKVEIVYAPRAINKIEDTYGYIADHLDNVPAAKKLVSTIREDVARLRTFPEMGQLLSSVLSRVPQDLLASRFIICGNYVVVYEFTDTLVKILEVYHTLEDIQGQLLSSDTTMQEPYSAIHE
ncbi:MAG: type II toxin-antitoxin system RelE/ParE family toxin [Coriobacteriia bacterium]|nr:type II toxin-antitoxin system RelE/ParE family toxin [Coriobacteriia bacterium]